MSDGRTAMYDEIEKERFQEHCDRITAMGPTALVTVLEELDGHLQGFDKLVVSMPRRGWSTLDDMRRLMAKLK